MAKWRLEGRTQETTDYKQDQDESDHRYLYSITSMARTRMARLPWMIRTLFSVPTKSSQLLKKVVAVMVPKP